MFLLILLLICFTLSVSSSSETPSPPLSPGGQYPSSPLPSSPLLSDVSFFPRTRTRRKKHPNAPFLVFANSCDHFSDAATALANSGFNVLVCSLPSPQSAVTDSQYQSLATAILKAMAWPRAVLVGCDGGSSAALATASLPQAAGLILCGDTKPTVRRLLEQRHEHPKDADPTATARITALQGELLRLACPCTVIVDDVTMPQRKPHQTAKQHRESAKWAGEMQTVIHGGGMAAHRRLPGQFSWVLVRFTEERLAQATVPISPTAPIAPAEEVIVLDDDDQQLDPPSDAVMVSPVGAPWTDSPKAGWRLSLERMRDTWFQRINFVVMGRVVATSIFWLVFGKTMLVQGRRMLLIGAELPNTIKSAPSKIPKWAVQGLVGIAKKVRGGLKLLPQPVPAPPSTGEGLRRARRFLKKGIDKGKELQKEFPLPPPPFMPKSFLLEEREEEEPAGKSASTSPSRTGGQAWLRWPARWRRFRPPKVVGPTVIDLEPHLIA